MAYYIDRRDNSIVINGFENGIADSPYEGISDIRNINLISIPQEASVNFSTSKISPPTAITGTIASVNATTDIITFTGGTNLESNMAVVFAGSLPTGLVAGTVYWIEILSPTTMRVYSNISLNTLIDLTTTTAGGTFTTQTMNIPKYFTYNPIQGYYYMVDAIGQVWTNASQFTGTGTNHYFIYAGNSGGSGAKNGNGLVLYMGSDGAQWLFTFRNSCIDYTRAEEGLLNNTSWVYGWNPVTGGSAAYTTLKTGTNINNPHEAIVAPDNKVYFTDSNWIDRFYQASPTTAFDPTNTTTYVWDQTQVLPFTDLAQCLAPLGNSILVGGRVNVVYPWDTFDPLPSYPILVAESNIVKMVTVNTNTFLFVGNRGRIYITNGSQAQLYKKIPDHISGTVEPYYTWGGATSNKNQLYFSASVTTNAGVANNNYGGLWAIDLDTKALRLTNKLSYNTYAGYATAIIPNFASTPAGTGLYIGWNDGASGYGIDTTISTPYTGGESIIVSDLIPVGTFDKPTDYERIEYKLSRPLVSGESVSIYARLIFDTSDTGFGTAILTDSTAGNYSSSAPINFKNAQWLQLEAILVSTASSPSYVRLTEFRIKQPTV